MPLLNVTPHTVGMAIRGGSLLGEALAALPVSKQASAAAALPEATVLKMGWALGMELRRVAGNIYEQPAKRSFWGVKDGGLVRLTGATTEVEDDEHMDPANVDDPEMTLNNILAGLEY